MYCFNGCKQKDVISISINCVGLAANLEHKILKV